MRVTQREICDALDVLAGASPRAEKQNAVERLLGRVGAYPSARRDLVYELKRSLQEETYSIPSEEVARRILVHCLLLEYLF